MNKTYKDYIEENVKVDVYKYKKDKKLHLLSNNKAQVLNLPHGYGFTLPTDEFTYDYQYSELRCKYFFNDCVLTTSFEDKNPYTEGNKFSSACGEKGWNIYLDEWLIRYISNEEYLKANRISKVIESINTDNFLGKFQLIVFSYYLNDSSKITYPYYNIAIIREKDDYKNFFLFVMKSKHNRLQHFVNIINSLVLFEKEGKASNIKETYEVVRNPRWNKMTKKYFDKLLNQNHIDWGIFTKSLTHKSDSAYNYISNFYKNEGLRLDNLMHHDFELLPTYMHISYNDKLNYFPMTLCNKLAKGNGFNGKKVLHFTFQYTANNNTSLFGYSPSFDILRGELDEYLRRLAKDIKKYHYPVLFRLNNEMNTDWTSYSGIASLLDPDIFIETWKRLYNIFEEEGVDNCIWIFNPIHGTTPFCNWGEYLNYYPKGMVNILGLTSYERGNMKEYSSFRKLYKNLYKKNSPYFDKFPQVISEFGSGAGGEVLFNYETMQYDYVDIRRNLEKQRLWVKNMFKEFKKQEDYTKMIKGAIWFSANDYAYKDGKERIMNYFQLDDQVIPTIRQFKKGFNK